MGWWSVCGDLVPVPRHPESIPARLSIYETWRCMCCLALNTNHLLLIQVGIIVGVKLAMMFKLKSIHAGALSRSAPCPFNSTVVYVLIYDNQFQSLVTYSSSLTLGFSASPSGSQAAGVPTSILYTHFSDSLTRHSSSVSAQPSQTSVLLFGPFQHPWPFSYRRTMRSPWPRLRPSRRSSSSAISRSMRSKLPMVVWPWPFLDFCDVLPIQQISYVYSPCSVLTHLSLSERKISVGP